MGQSKKTKKDKPKRSSSRPKDAKSKGGGAVNGIEVQATGSVTSECTRALRKVIDNSTIGFQEEEFPQEKRVKCRLIGEGAKIAVTDKERYSVLPVLEARSILYWLGIQLEFHFIPTDVYRLTSVSLVLFRGESSDPMKTPLLRAEWDWREPKGPFIHAQPHWHLYRSILSEVIVQEEVISDKETDDREIVLLDEVPNTKEEDWKKASDFHFAMASTWHIDATNSPQTQINDPKNLISWMSGCVSYTIGQLRYLNK
jgi:hypothetical protein